MAREGAPEGTLISAFRQTQGRGRSGKPWISSPGDLTFSLVLRPRCSGQEVTALSFILGVAIGHALVTLRPSSLRVSYKWPNDILVEGYKIAGILTEIEPSPQSDDSPPRWVVGGVGLNVVSCPSGTPFPATSLAALGIKIQASQFLASFCLELQELLRLWKGQGFQPIRDLWMARVWGLYREMHIAWPGNRVVEGIFEDITEDGSLLLRNSVTGNKQVVSTGEIMRLQIKNIPIES